MEPLSRRKFITQSAAATGAAFLSPYLVSCSQMQPHMKAEYFLKEFGIDNVICRKLLGMALARGGDFADLFFEHTLTNTLILEDGKVNKSYGEINLGVGIRTVKDDRVGYGYTQTLTEESMIQAAITASSLVNLSKTPVSKKFSGLETGNYYPVGDDFG